MFSHPSRPIHRPTIVAHAQDYISNISESQIAQTSNDDRISVRHGLDQMVCAINPSTVLSHAQQDFVRIEREETFVRYFYSRDTLGHANAEFQLDMRLLQIATFVNTSYTLRGGAEIALSWLMAPISAIAGIFSQCSQLETEPAPVKKST